MIQGYISNIYLVEYPASILLLDSGSISDVKAIQSYCENICGRPMSDISLCVVSHMHPDHAGGAALLRKKFGIPIAAFHTADKWYAGITGFIQHTLDCRMEQFVSKTIGKKKKPVYFARKLHPDYPLVNGGPLPVFGDWKMIHIPGHTLHDIAIYNSQEKILHTGDAILTVNGRFRLPIPVFFKGTMRASYAKLSCLDVEIILPGHGDIINTDDPAGLFAHMSGLLDEPKSDMSRAAHGISMLTPAVWKGTIRHLLHRITCS
jgi:glyoxylase-like metal-dependent hydrolase (beta-lactamase superfamily II)